MSGQSKPCRIVGSVAKNGREPVAVDVLQRAHAAAVEAGRCGVDGT